MPRIATLNVKGLKDLSKFESLCNLARANAIDLLIATESHIDNLTANKLTATARNIALVTNCPDPRSGGVTLINFSPETINWDPDRDVFYRDGAGRALGVIMTIDGDPEKRLRVLGVYLPNEPHKQSEYLELLTGNGPRKVDIMLGDFNMVERRHFQCGGYQVQNMMEWQQGVRA